MKLRAKALISTFLLLSLPAAASDHKIFFGAGVVAENIARFTNDDADTGVSLLGRDYLQLTVRAQFGSFVPSIGFTPLGVGSPEGGEKTRLLTVRTCWNLALGDIDLLVGPGLLHRMVSGAGGTVTLNNGNTTQDFFVPSTSASQNLLFLNLGFGHSFGDIRYDLDAWIFNLLGAGRSLDAVITVSYGL